MEVFKRAGGGSKEVGREAEGFRRRGGLAKADEVPCSS